MIKLKINVSSSESFFKDLYRERIILKRFTVLDTISFKIKKFTRTNRHLKLITLLFFSLLTFNSFAQSSDFIFEGTTPFRISINKVVQENQYCTSLKITNLQGEKHYNIKVEFENDTTFIQQTEYILDNGFAYYYQVSKTTLALHKIVPNQLIKTDTNQMVFAYTNNPSLIIDSIPTDTLVQKDTAYLPPFANYFKMDNYTGKIACAWPIKAEALTEIKAAINTQTLEDSKLDIAKEKTQYIDSLCITVNQLREVLLLFEYEETKLDYAKFVAPHIFDIDNIGKLNDVFDFENSIDEIKLIIGI